MTTSNQLLPGMVIMVGKKMYKVESSVKVTVPKGTPFIKAKLKSLADGEEVEKSFKPSQKVQEVSLKERPLEYLYQEGKDYQFFDLEELATVLVTKDVVGKKIHYLKEGFSVVASFYEDMVFSIDLPQFLEIMITDTEGDEEDSSPVANMTKVAILETGAKIKVPPFIEIGDVIKVDTKSGEYIQRV